MDNKKLNDQDRAEWVNNDESLYLWWRGTGKGITSFVRENRSELTQLINARLNRPARA